MKDAHCNECGHGRCIFLIAAVVVLMIVPMLISIDRMQRQINQLKSHDAQVSAGVRR